MTVTIDLRQLAALAGLVVLGAAIFAAGVLAGGRSPEPSLTRQPPASAPVAAPGRPNVTRSAAGSALDLYDDNGNGRITCAEARNHGIAPVRRGHPAYPYMRDSNDDGRVCG